MKRFSFILSLVIALGTSCADHDGTITSPDAARRPDMVSEEAGVTARYFGVDNPYAIRRAADTERSPIAVSALRGFRDAGYVYVREGSFPIEGEGAEGEGEGEGAEGEGEGEGSTPAEGEGEASEGEGKGGKPPAGETSDGCVLTAAGTPPRAAVGQLLVLIGVLLGGGLLRRRSR